jgi:hypothetical protein
VPASVACAVVHDEPPQVLLAEDLDTLHWVLALRLVAATPPEEVPVHLRAPLRDALLEERWADAVVMWMSFRAGAIDVYPSHDLFGPGDLPVAGAELQFRPLFHD